MVFINLNSLDTVSNLCNICNKYKEDLEVDIKHGRQIVDGCSVLGVTSLIGNIVKIEPITRQSNSVQVEEFYMDVRSIGAYDC